MIPILLALSLVAAVAVMGCAAPSPATPTTNPTSQPAIPVPPAPIPNLSGSLKVIGSNTVTPISSVWAEMFMKANPKVSIAVSGPGSGVGIAAFIDGTTDICQSSRPITAAEIDKAKANGRTANEIIVAFDGLAIVVNPKNPVNELTMEQISDIYSGKITNWKQVGGDDAEIVALSRDSNSGTHVFFKEHVVQMKDKKAEFGQGTLFLPSTESGVTEVAKNAKAIFFPGLGYVTKDLKILGVKKDAASPAVKPSIATVHDKTYPVSRPLFFYVNGQPAGLTKAFIDYAVSKTGQTVVEYMGFVPLS
jgi:phosphate transport system substrate-binding protein